MRNPALTLLLGLTLAIASASAAVAVEAKPRAVILGKGPAAGAPGRELVLYQVTVPPRVALATHRHPGTQLGRVVSGTLTYTVVRGAVEVYRFAPDGSSRLVRTVRSGQTTRLVPGETVVEQPADIHRARNATGRPVRLVLTTLPPEGSPLAVPATG